MRVVLHVLSARELSPDEIRQWRPAWRDVSDDRLPVVRQVVCSCGEWRSDPAEPARLQRAWNRGHIHRLLMDIASLG